MFDGSGNFIRNQNFVSDSLASPPGNVVDAGKVDNEFDNFKAGLSKSLLTDGQSVVTANIPMAGYRFTNVANSNGPATFLAAGEAAAGTIDWVGTFTQVGSNPNTLSCTYTLLPSSPSTGSRIKGVIPADINAGGVTLVVNALPAAPVLRADGSALLKKDLKSGRIMEFYYKGSSWYVLNPLTVDGRGSPIFTLLTSAQTALGPPSIYTATAASANFNALVSGQLYAWKCPANNSGPVTLNVDSSGAVNVVDGNGTALTANAVQSNRTYILMYDGTNFIQCLAFGTSSGGSGSVAHLSDIGDVSVGGIAAGGVLVWTGFGWSPGAVVLTGDPSVALGAATKQYVDATAATASAAALAARSVLSGGLATGGGALSINQTITVPAASTVDAQTGTSTTLVMTPGTTLDEITQFALRKSNNLSDLAAITTARVNLGVDKRTGNGDSNYSILTTDKFVATTATLTTARTWTLPAASGLNAGQVLYVGDEFGGVNGANTLTIQRAGSDTINGSTSVVIDLAYGAYVFISNGTSKWLSVRVNAASVTNFNGVSGAITGVNSFNARTGVVVPLAGDYSSFRSIDMPLNIGLTATVAANALTIALKDASGADASSTSPIGITFRNGTITSGATVARSVAGALSVVVPSGQAVGTASGIPSRLWVVAIDNGGTVELAVINCLIGGATPTGIYPLSENGLITTTAIAAAPIAGVFYSTTARTTKSMRVLGFVDFSAGQATAGTWATSPSSVNNFGPGVSLPGTVVQRAFASTGAMATGTAVIPLDNTIPQNTEGFQVITNPITPTATMNLLEVASSVSVYDEQNDLVTVALFQDSVANALQAQKIFANATTIDGQIIINHRLLASTVSATTFKLRAGANTLNTVTINGRSGVAIYGGTNLSYLNINEIQA